MEILHFEDLGDISVVWLRNAVVLGGYQISIATYLRGVSTLIIISSIEYFSS